MISKYIDMDTHNIRYVNESSNASTSGYSTMSPGQNSVLSTPPSPSQSPSSMLQTEFSNLNLPSSAGSSLEQPNYTTLQNATLYGLHSLPQAQVQIETTAAQSFVNYNTTGGSVGVSNPMVSMTQHQYGANNLGGVQNMVPATMRSSFQSTNRMKQGYPAELRILEHPVEKFRFRYKSEMHGTHGSLNGANSKRTPKTFPEVELRNFSGHAVIRCSLFQTNLDSPHSHQLVVRKDDTDICDPHDLHVSPERGYVAQFQNMGIIHTAKKFIIDELLKKKTSRLQFELGRDELTTKEIQELHKETEKEAKEMNLNQVRLCFEAFKVEPEENIYTRIAAPVYTNPINNRKSAQTGELRICRLSIATGNVAGGDDLILLVEKVSKKNIKVRFFELNEEEGLIWEAFGKFRESDVHHQYAIVCQTPAYKNKDIEKPVDVFIELVRPSDDERSYPPVSFRYRPRDVVISRKRRRTTSTATSSSGSASSLSSFELPKPVQEQAATMKLENKYDMSISEEFDKMGQINNLMDSAAFKELLQFNSEELAKLCPPPENIPDICDLQLRDGGHLEHDGTSSFSNDRRIQQVKSPFAPIDEIFEMYNKTQADKNLYEIMKIKVEDIFHEHAERNDHRETILTEIFSNENTKLVQSMCRLLHYFDVTHLFNKLLNARNESALHAACLHNRVLYIRPLLGMGCDPNIQNCNGKTALHIAVENEYINCIESFLNREGQRIDLSIKNDAGFTVLHLAIRQKNIPLCRKLLDYNRAAAFVPNAKDNNNALHMAVLEQNLELVKLVLEKQNAVELVRTRNASGRNAFDLVKDIDCKVGKEIETYLGGLLPSEYERAVIKEEISSSSTEDDEDNDAYITIKEEFIERDDSDAHDVKVFNRVKLRKVSDLLNDEDKFQKLVKDLNASGKWKELATALQQDHLLCLWSNASDLLNYLIRKKVDVEYSYDDFLLALKSVDAKAYTSLFD